MLFFNWLLHIFLKEILTNRVNAYANNGIVFDFILLKKTNAIRTFIGKLERNDKKIMKTKNFNEKSHGMKDYSVCDTG